MNKKLLIIIVFLSTPIFGMDYLNQIKRWITQNPSGAPAVPGERITPLPTLPAEIQVNEVVKQLLNVSSTRDQALTLLSNYAQVNKAIANYVKNNKTELQGLLDQKFDLSLIALASGNYDDPKIKAESLRILTKFPVNQGFYNWSAYILDLVDYIKTGQRGPDYADHIPYAELDFLNRLLNSNNPNNFSIAAVTLGIVNNTFNNNNAIFTEREENGFVDVLKDATCNMGKDKNWTQIIALIINTALKIFGPHFINKEDGFYFPYSGTLLNHVRNFTNQEAINYLEKINKLNK